MADQPPSAAMKTVVAAATPVRAVGKVHPRNPVLYWIP